MKMKFLLLICLLSAGAINAQVTDKQSPLLNIIEIPHGILAQNVLSDLPGSLVLLIPDSSGGNYRPYLVGEKVLKNNAFVPKVKTEPKLIMSQVADKSLALSASYLSFVSGNMENTDEVKYTVTETSNTSIVNGDVDWKRLNERIKNIRKANPTLSPKTIFGVLQVANVIEIHYQLYKKVSKAGKISGWGFAGDAKYLSEKRDESMHWMVGASLLYPDNSIITLSSNISANLYYPKKHIGNSISDDLKDYIPMAYKINIDVPVKEVPKNFKLK
ncbi:hypothetical protein [Arachidicoccus terrestris]|uniref:hypothetical protein n=1 Tax=Arachidicoccus terrestris TaxID=2875539 RepID=UPI001CC5433E|nr:hypothetical protein [Arachidicoccus terrestris]UAY55688.1 hypothetical protein K9M52_01250 [Arachidicoccus terrestris]